MIRLFHLVSASLLLLLSQVFTPAFAAPPPHSDVRIATSWPAQNTILAMLGYGKNIVGTSAIAKRIPLFRQTLPGIVNVPDVSMTSSHDINPEQILAQRAQLLFVPENMHVAKQDMLEQAGVKVMALPDNAMAAMVERVVETAQVLGPDAQQKAQRFQAYFNHNVALVRSRLAGIPDNQRLRVYHAMMTPLMTSGKPSLNDDWITLAGGKNVAATWFGGKANATGEVPVERAVAADPQVIIAMTNQTAQMIEHSPQWQSTSAVKNHRVFVNPRGMFWWCRETSEEALQFVWLAKKLYPAQFQDVDMSKMTHDFYQNFFGLNLTAAQVQNVLAPQR